MGIDLELKERKKRSWKLKTIPNQIVQLEQYYDRAIERSPSSKELSLFQLFMQRNDIRGGEYFFCPETMFYAPVLTLLSKKDVVLDIGAGDLRFDLRMAQKVKKVYAVEINPVLLADVLRIIGYAQPKNLVIICGNGFKLPIPLDVSIILCLMIHKAHNPRHWENYKQIIAYPAGLALRNFSLEHQLRFRKYIEKKERYRKEREKKEG